MAWFPLFLDLSGKKCLVAGGGAVALRKVRSLLECGAEVTVAAPEVLPQLAALPARFLPRKVEEADLAGCALVVDATGDPTVGEALSRLCGERGLPLNVVDMPQYCSVIFPAVLRRGKLTAAISTGGASPLAAAWVRDRLSEALPDCFEAILDQMEALRPLAKSSLPQQPRRAAFLRACLAAALEKGRPLTEAEIGAYLSKEEASL